MPDECGEAKPCLVSTHQAGYVGTVLSHSAILEREVFLVETITRASPQPMRHLKGVFFLRPTSSNVKLLREHLHRPQFAEYHLFFTNIARDSILKVSLAQAASFWAKAFSSCSRIEIDSG